MLDQDKIDEYRSYITERFTAPELADMMEISSQEFFDRFIDEVLEFDFSDYT